jgi:hypothetical protein
VNDFAPLRIDRPALAAEARQVAREVAERAGVSGPGAVV